MNKSYIETKKERDAFEEEKNHIMFGLVGGVILVLAGALNWLSTTGFWAVVCVCVFALGVLLLLFALAVPSLLKYPYQAFLFWGNLVGKAVFTVILTILYCLFILPVGLLLRRKRQAQGYFAWDETRPEPRSLFTELPQTDRAKAKTGKASYFGILYNLLSVFVANRKFILIPVVILLVVVGLILFFVSSNVLTAFIYTLF